MTTEPTLADRIMAAAETFSHADRIVRNQETMDHVYAFGDGAVKARDEARAALAALCRQADAAERVALAADVVGWTDALDYMRGADEFKDALEAWQEVGG